MMRKSQVEHEARQSNGWLLVSLWGRVGSKPSLLKFHGITEDDLKSIDIDSEELSYLVASFEAAGYYYEHIDKDDGSFLPSTLRLWAKELAPEERPVYSLSQPVSPKLHRSDLCHRSLRWSLGALSLHFYKQVAPLELLPIQLR